MRVGFEPTIGIYHARFKVWTLANLDTAQFILLSERALNPQILASKASDFASLSIGQYRAERRNQTIDKLEYYLIFPS